MPDNSSPGRLLSDEELQATPAVANRFMNRGRRLSSYRKELGFDPLTSGQSWLDLCCGEGQALMEAAPKFRGVLLGVAG